MNVLVHAFRREAEQHDEYARWLGDVVAGADELALHDVVLAGFVRIVTNPRIMADPAPTPAALDFMGHLRDAARARWLSSGPAVWATFERIATDDRGVRGNLVPDALLAALALTHGAVLATADRGFARFPGLRTIAPAASPPVRG